MTRPFFNRAPSILAREPVTNSFATGWNIIDCIFPLGRGQRELIVGDRETGKKTIFKGFVANQKRSNRWLSPDGRGRKRLWCFTANLGKPAVGAMRIGKYFRKRGAMWYSNILSTPSGNSAALIYLSAYESCAMAECYRDIGYSALTVYYDMNNHGKSYRQMALLVGNPPGREAFPGDMFYQHSRLLERAAQLSKKNGYGSLSSFPIYETQKENIKTLLCTNLISITDGQIYLSKYLFRNGFKPAIDLKKSVSRIGIRAQSELLTWACEELRDLLLSYLKVERWLQMGIKLKPRMRYRHNKATSALGI
jgi:F-type H+-transporting ATPase subunit alpha